jgi:hypothetical protein
LFPPCLLDLNNRQTFFLGDKGKEEFPFSVVGGDGDGGLDWDKVFLVEVEGIGELVLPSTNFSREGERAGVEKVE